MRDIIDIWTHAGKRAVGYFEKKIAAPRAGGGESKRNLIFSSSAVADSHN
jgi:hypothetical protein